MPSQEKIPFTNAQAPGLEELDGNAPLALNVVMKGGVVRRRPGLAYLDSAVGAFTDAEGGASSENVIEALCATTGGDVFGVRKTGAHRDIIRVDDAGRYVSMSHGASGSSIVVNDLRGALRPTIAETEAMLVFAGGEEPEKLLFSDLSVSRLGGSPPSGSHVVSHNLRILINDLSGTKSQWWYSDIASGTSVAGHETWNSGDSDFVSATARPDPVVAIAENTNEVFVWGATSLQTYAPDGDTVYAPVANHEVGCAAPYSVVKTDQNFLWLDHLRRFVISDGKSVTVISDPIQSVLNGFDDVSGVYGFRFIESWIDAAFWIFPDGRIFAFQKGAGWGQWGSGTNGATALDVTAHCRTENANLIGNSDGNVVKMSASATTDLGEPIHAEVISGFLDRGTSRRKHCQAVRLTLRRGETTGTSEPFGFLSWRDDLGEWNAPIKVSLGAVADTQAVVTLRSVGWPYRKRQWRFTFAGTEDLILAGATEEFELLED